MSYKTNTYYPVKWKDKSLLFKIGVFRGRDFSSYPWIALYEQRQGKFLFWNYTYHKLLAKDNFSRLVSRKEAQVLEQQSPYNAAPGVELALRRLLQGYDGSSEPYYSLNFS
jgi:hypothetical protein